MINKKVMKYRISFTIESTSINVNKIKKALKPIDIDVENEITTFPNYIKVKKIK